MKAIGITLLVLAGLMVLVTIVGTLKAAIDAPVQVGIGNLMRYAQSRIIIYSFPGVTWAGIGMCCLGLDALIKRKGAVAEGAQAIAPASQARAPQAAPTITPARPAIRPASDEPRPDRQDTPGQ